MCFPCAAFYPVCFLFFQISPLCPVFDLVSARPHNYKGALFLGPIKLMCNCLFLLSLCLVWPGRGMIGRGRGGFGGRGRGRGRGRGALTRPVLTKEQLDNQLDAYMSKTKGHLDAELDAYMAQTDPETND